MSSNEFKKLYRDYTEREDYLASRAAERGAPIRAHDKSQYKRLVAQGANVVPPNKGCGMKIELTLAVIECFKRGLNCWAKQNDAEGIEIKEILRLAEKIAEDV